MTFEGCRKRYLLIKGDYDYMDEEIIKVKKVNLVDQVSNQLKELIVEGKWTIGKKIPSENSLADKFDVSRLTVRLAIQKLVTLGILETKAGAGTFVKEFNFDGYVKKISDIMMKPEMLDDVQDFRRHIEIECGRLAIKQATNHQIMELERAVKHYNDFIINGEKGLEYNVNRLAALDYSFHYKLCQISNNSLFLLAYTAAKEPIIQYLKSIIKSRLETFFVEENINIENSKRIQVPDNSHYNMVLAIKAKDFAQFKKIFYQMVNYKNTTPIR